MAVSIISIIITAPIGALCIDLLGYKLLEKEEDKNEICCVNSQLKENTKENINININNEDIKSSNDKLNINKNENK